MVFYDRYARKTTVKRALDAWRAESRAQMEARADALVANRFTKPRRADARFERGGRRRGVDAVVVVIASGIRMSTIASRGSNRTAR